jgi:transcriptional regulator with XRE-family HTH domain
MKNTRIWHHSKKKQKYRRHMSKLINNLERRMRLRGLTQKSLALKAGLNETAIRDILKGRSKDPQFTTLNGIARVLGCAVEDLFGDPPKLSVRAGVGEAAPQPYPASVGVEAEEAAPFTSDLYIDELDLVTSPSPKALADGRRQRAISTWQIPEDAIEKFLGNHADLKIARVLGDSMAPDFTSGDRVLINIADKTPSPPGIFLLWDGAGFVLRRCELRPNAKPPRIVMHARNPAYGSQETSMKDVIIAGRVLGRWQKV